MIKKFPAEWKMKNIRNTTYLKGRIGWQGLRASEFILDGPFLVTGTDFHNGVVQWDKCYHITQKRFQEAPSIHLKDNDLLITKDGTIGKTAIVRNCPKYAVLNSGIFLMRSHSGDYEHEFMHYLLNSETFKKFLRDTQAGTTINHLYQNIFENFEFPCPEINEQRKITEILKKVDEAIEQIEQIIAKQERLKTGLMQDLFTKGIDENGNIRDEKTHKLKDSPIGKMTLKFDAFPLSEIVDFVGSGITPRGGSEIYLNEGIPFIRSQNIYNSGIVLNNIAHISKSIHNMMKRTKVQNYDILLNITGASIGRCTYVPEGFPESNVNQHVCIIRLKNVDKNYAFFYSRMISSFIGQRQINILNAGSNREGLNYQQVRNLIVPVPKDKQEIIKISGILNGIENTISFHKEDVLKLQHIKAGLMQDLLTGRVRVNHLIEAVA